MYTPPDKVQRGLVTHLRSNSCCVAELGPRPTSVCHQSLPSHLDRLGGPSSLIAQCLPLPTPSGKSQNQSSCLTGSSSLICLLLPRLCKYRPHHPWSQLWRQPPTRPRLPPPCFSSLYQGSCPKPKPFPASKLSQTSTPCTQGYKQIHACLSCLP